MSVHTALAPVVLEPASQAFVEATAKPPFLYELTPAEARAVLDDVQAAPIDKLPVQERWIAASRPRSATCACGSSGPTTPFWDAYAPDIDRRAEPYASPLRASDEQIAGLPPAFLIINEADVLRDKGEAYAARLRAAERGDHDRPLRRHHARLHDAQPAQRHARHPRRRRPSHRRPARGPPHRLTPARIHAVPHPAARRALHDLQGAQP
jgi:hypothetical protein